MICPRCLASHDGEFYGPCDACREQLRVMRPPAPDARFGKPEPIPYDPNDPPRRPVPTEAAS